MIPMLTRFLECLMSRWLLPARLYTAFYSRLAGREIALANISAADRVLCIGGGPIPATAINIAQKTGASIYVVDCDPHIAEHSRTLLARLGLAGMITVGNEDGSRLDPGGFSVVHIARQVVPRSKVVSNITGKADDDTRIILRVPPKAIACLYDSERCWNVKCKLANTCLGRENSLLIRRTDDEKVPALTGRAAVGSAASLVG